MHRVLNPGGLVLLCAAEEKASFQKVIDRFQYPVLENDILSQVQLQGFTLEQTKRWRPLPHYKDWYVGKRSRFVIELKK